MDKPITLASRPSALAQVQTNTTADALRTVHPQRSFDTLFISSGGDKNKSQALYLLGGKALWTKELEVALLDGEVDMLVHCLKDMPTSLPPGCELAAITEREEPQDCLVVKEGLPYKSLDELPSDAIIGTSSVRRVAQLRRKYPSFVFRDIRGNLDTRLAKLNAPDGPFAAIVLAKAGLVRLGLGSRVTCDLNAPTMYYAVGQAALGIEIRARDDRIKTIAQSLNHWPTEWTCKAERACLRILEGGCSVPVGVETSLVPVTGGSVITTDPPQRCKLTIIGTVTSLNGDAHIEQTVDGEVESAAEAESLGVKLARLLISQGAGSILEEIGKDQEARLQNEPAAEEKLQQAVQG